MRHVVTNTGRYRHIEDLKYPGWTLCSRKVRIRPIEGSDVVPAGQTAALEGIPVDPEIGAPDCSKCEIRAKRALGYE